MSTRALIATLLYIAGAVLIVVGAWRDVTEADQKQHAIDVANGER